MSHQPTNTATFVLLVIADESGPASGKVCDRCGTVHPEGMAFVMQFEVEGTREDAEAELAQTLARMNLPTA